MMVVEQPDGLKQEEKEEERESSEGAAGSWRHHGE
jgi:hypothetical protein